MAKNKTKISAAQRDKTNISIAKELKKAGLISKQAKLHSGKFISKAVLKKVRELSVYNELDYRAVKASKATIKAAKERGYTVINNKIVGPNTQTFRNRIRSGTLTGVKPVKGGLMEQVILPHSVMDMQSLIDQLEAGIDSLKLPDENFAFKFAGNESYRSFFDTKSMLEYLQRYKGFTGLDEQGRNLKPEDIQESFEALTIYRLHPASEQQNIRGPRQRRLDRQKERIAQIEAGTYISKGRKRKSAKDRAALMGPIAGAKYLEKLAQRDRLKREALAADPIKLAQYRQKAAARAAKSRQNRKG